MLCNSSVYILPIFWVSGMASETGTLILSTSSLTASLWSAPFHLRSSGRCTWRWSCRDFAFLFYGGNFVVWVNCCAFNTKVAEFEIWNTLVQNPKHWNFYHMDSDFWVRDQNRYPNSFRVSKLRKKLRTWQLWSFHVIVSRKQSNIIS